MSTTTSLQNHPAQRTPSRGSPHVGLLLQRKCACGTAAPSPTGECTACKDRKTLQAKLTMGAKSDPLEQEADRVANQVTATTGHAAASISRPHIQRFTGQTAGQRATAPASVDNALAGPGRPLDAPLRQDMEHHFGHDFSRVRVHTGAAAEQSARDVNAHAYTVGNNIVFGPGRQPAANRDRHLLAHELTHVVQQSASAAPPLQRETAAPSEDSKRDAVAEMEPDDPIDDYETGADNELPPGETVAANDEQDEDMDDGQVQLDDSPKPAAGGKRIVVQLPGTLIRFEGGKRIGSWGISGGKPGHETPQGSFSIGRRDENHTSSSYGTCNGKRIGPDGAAKCKQKGGTYVGADMRFFQEFAGGGIGFHRGDPSVPSHGCIHVSGKNAETLWNWAAKGTPVVVCSGASGCAPYLGGSGKKKKK